MNHYYSKKQRSSLKLKMISVNIKGIRFEFYTGSGVFSKRRIDLGSKLLINKMKVFGRVLDLGCGYGVMGLFASKFGAKEVILSDINERALMLAEKNALLNNINNVKVVKSDGFTNIKNKFDVILLNPPQTAGKKVCFRLIENAKKHLKKKGSLQLVARHNKGGKVLSEKMNEVFENVEVLGRGYGYRVYMSKLL